MAPPSPETGNHPDSIAPALQGPPHPTPKEPAAGSIAPLLRTALQCHRQRPDCLASRLLHAHRCAPLGGGRSHDWRSEWRGAQGAAGLGQSEGPTSFRGRWTQLTRKGLLGQGPSQREQRQAEGRGALPEDRESGSGRCARQPLRTQPVPWRGRQQHSPMSVFRHWPEAVSQIRLRSDTKHKPLKRQPLPTAHKLPRTHRAQLAFPPPCPPTLGSRTGMWTRMAPSTWTS